MTADGDGSSDDEHGSIGDPFVAPFLEYPRLRDFTVLHKHVSAGNGVVLEAEVAVILGIEAVLGADVACLDSWQQLPIVVPNGHQKRMQSVLLALDDELGEDDGVVGISAQVPNPPLIGHGVRHVHDERLTGFVVCGSGHQALDVGAVAHLGLGIAPPDFSLDRGFIEEFFLLVSAQIVESDDEHVEVHGEWELLSVEEGLFLFSPIVE